MEDRRSRNNKIPPKQLSKQFDVLKYGSKEDPCYAKLWDPRNEICQMCGDIEICGIAFSQNLSKREAELETLNTFLDVKERDEREKMIERFVRKRLDEYEKEDLIRLLRVRFKISKEKALTYIE